MFTLNESTAEITIDFTASDLEHPEVEPTVTTVVVAPPPTVGAYKRLRAEIDRINRGRDKLFDELVADSDVGGAEMTSRLNGYQEDQLLAWWKLVMAGDGSYRGQATPAPPEDIDAWPLYLVSNEAMQLALAHWKKVPSGSGV